MAATRAGQGRDAEDTEDTEDIEDTDDTKDTEDTLATGQEGDRSKEEAVAGNTDDYDEISTII